MEAGDFFFFLFMLLESKILVIQLTDEVKEKKKEKEKRCKVYFFSHGISCLMCLLGILGCGILVIYGKSSYVLPFEFITAI